METDSPYMDNLLGAFALALVDRTTLALESALGAGGNTLPALLTIGTRPDRSVDELAQTLALSHSATVRIVDRLEESGWVQRMRADKDSRRVLLRLTTPGRKAFHRLLEARRQALSEVTGSLSQKEKEELSRLVSKMLATIPKSRVEARHICRLCEHSICQGSDCPVGSAVA